MNIDKSGTSATSYRRDNDGTLHSEVLPSGARHYYLFDGLGSVAALSDATGAKSQSYTYDPYGATTVNNATGPANPWRYAATYQDSTGFYKMGLRYYSPALQRWTQLDQLDQAGDVQQGDRYAYVGGSPVNRVDPGGERYYNDDSTSFCESYTHYVGCAVKAPVPRAGGSGSFSPCAAFNVLMDVATFGRNNGRWTFNSTLDCSPKLGPAA